MGCQLPERKIRRIFPATLNACPQPLTGTGHAGWIAACPREAGMYKVLIAEDEAIVRLGLKNMLDWESMGMQVTALAGDGEEAWQL